MTSLHKYAARRHNAFYYSPGFDPTVATGTPVPEPIPSPAELALAESRDRNAPIEEQINEPLGFVEEVAREYARLRKELGPRPDAAPVLEEKALRRQRKAEQAKQEERERAIFWVQYQKLLDQKEYVDGVYERMGYLDQHLKDQFMEDYVRETFPETREFVQGSSKGRTR